MAALGHGKRSDDQSTPNQMPSRPSPASVAIPPAASSVAAAPQALPESITLATGIE